MANILGFFMEIIVMNCKVVFTNAVRLLFSKGEVEKRKKTVYAQLALGLASNIYCTVLEPIGCFVN